MSVQFKVGDLVVRLPESRGTAGWPYGDRVCRVIGHYHALNEIIVTPHDGKQSLRHDRSGWAAERFAPASMFTPARRNDPATSKAAAKAPRVTLAQKVLDLLALYPAGLTGEEIATRLNARLNSVTPRFAQLRRLDLVEHSGHFRSGQIVWVLAGKAAV